MTARMWILRVGLTFELLGALVLAFDLLNDSIRKRISTGIEHSIDILTANWVFLSLPIFLSIYLIIIMNEVLGIWQHPVLSEAILLLIEFFTLITFSDYITGGVRPLFSMYIIVATIVHLYHPLPKKPGPSLIKFINDPRNYRPNISTEDFILQSMESRFKKLIAYVGYIAIFPMILVLFIHTSALIVILIMIGVSFRILILPLTIGFKLEGKGTISSGIRFGGLFLLSFGFLTQIISTFL